jgi:enterochelin esterase-like enzyme
MERRAPLMSDSVANVAYNRRRSMRLEDDMTRLRVRAREHRGIALVVCAVVAGLAGPAAAQTAAPVKKGTVERIMVHGASLAGNLEGDSPARDVFVYLPPSYATSRNQRYPVVYVLHGYGLTAERWMTFTNLAEAADKTIAAGTIKEMILVSPDAFTKHSGSMYSSSPTTGDWESYIAEDLVSYIDSHYRTIANRMSRGLGGHSMGGYGTIRIGMKRPDVFSSLDVMSACCLMQNAVPGQGNRGAAPQRGAAPEGARAAAPPPDRSGEPAAAGRGERGRGAGAGQGRGRGGFGNVQAALAAAWSPNPKNPPDFFDMPVKDGEPQPLVIAKWAANSPLAMIDQYVTNLKKYKAIMIEVGTADGLAASNRQMDQILTDFGVAHTFETYEGDHTNRVVERIETKVLPFFSRSLSFNAPRR